MSSGVLTVSLSAVASNFRRIQRHVGPKVEVGGVVKANAYGLGVDRVAPALEAEGCRTFLVATLNEGIEVRTLVSEGAAVVAMGGVAHGRADEYLRHGITPVVNSLPQLKALRAAAESRLASGAAGRHRRDTPFPFFLQIDTGMTRLGLDAEERASMLDRPQAAIGDALRLETVMSHFACADATDVTFTERQFDNFVAFTDALRSELRGSTSAAFRRSLANSAGLFRDARYHMELVRPGMSLYGLKANEFETCPAASKVSPVVRTVHATVPVIQVRRAERGAKVGYSATYEVPHEEGAVIGVAAVGYADGLKRFCSGRGAALYWTPPTSSRQQEPLCPADDDFVNSEPHAAVEPETYRLPLVGRVSMDAIMVDLTHVPAAHRPQEGDLLELLGPHQPPDELASYAGTIGYEVLTSFGSRYDRVYV
jgi:alanine racemase